MLDNKSAALPNNNIPQANPLNDLITKINDIPTFYQAQAERSLLEAIGGDCHTALAGHATEHTFKAEMFEDGKHSGIIELESPFGGWGMAQKLREGLDSSPG